MDLRQLSALIAVGDEGSFSRAAEALDTVQSNISAHVKRLEGELGTSLVDRRSLKLTEAGRLVASRARRAFGELDALVSDVLALRHDIAGTVRIGVIGTTSRWLVPQLLELTPDRFPALRLVFLESTTIALDVQLATGQIDLAVLNLTEGAADLLLTPLFEEDLVLVTSIDHPLANAAEITLAALDGVPILLPYRGTALRDELERATAPLGITLVGRAEVDGMRLIASLTLDGYGPAILPATAIPRHLADRCCIVRVHDLPPRVVGVAQRARTIPSAPTRAVLDLLTEIVSDPERTPAGLTAVTPDRSGRSRVGQQGPAVISAPAGGDRARTGGDR
ncbi:MAG: LysR family transcriptional regulator, partial [Acidimicrobiales bacterium]